MLPHIKEYQVAIDTIKAKFEEHKKLHRQLSDKCQKK